MTGLIKLKKDERDFQLHKVLGIISLSSIPDEFTVSSPLKIHDQKATNMCTGMVGAALAEDELKEEVSAEHFFAAEGKLDGVNLVGHDLRIQQKVFQKIGVLLQKYTTWTVDNQKFTFLADPNNWPEELWDESRLIKPKWSFFNTSGPYDTFDNFRMAMYLTQRPLSVGCEWQEEWTNERDGVIRTHPALHSIGGHDIKVNGIKMISGSMYLIIQNSYGPTRGDGGIYYFSREITNQFFGGDWGSYAPIPIDPAHAKVLNEYSLSLKWLWVARLVAWVNRLKLQLKK